jgi:WD40 repeat protein
MRHQDGVTFAQFSPDGQRVVTVSQDGTAWLWEAASSTRIGGRMRHGAVVTFVQFSPDGQRVVTASRDGTARLWDAASGQAIGEPMQHGGVVTSAQFSPDGQRVVTASWNGTARLWDAITGHAIGEPMQHEGVVASAQFSPDGQRVVTASYDGTARVWEAAIGQTMAEPMEHQKDVVSAQFSPDGRRVVTASMDGTARLWEAATGKPIGEPMKHGDAVRSAQFSPDGQRIVTASDDSTAQLWAVASGQAIGKPMVHKGGRLAEQLIRIVWSAQFSPDGKRVVTASFNGEARLWDAESGQSIGEPMKHGGKVWSAQFSLDGQRVVTACGDNLVTYPPILSNTARVWDAATGQALSEPMKHDGMVHSAQFSPDGQRVVTASFDKTARVWDAATGQALSEPMRHGGKVLSAQFSPDGQRVVTASDDNTARLWDAASGQAIGKPMKHGGAVNSARFSPDGQRVVTASSDGTARVWDVPAVNSIDTREDLLLLADLAEATGGVALQTSGQAEMLNVLAPEQVRATREKMAARFAAPSSSLTPLQRCLKWSVSERRSQTISPFSELTIPEWVDNRINEGTPEGLRAAILIEPANARLAAQFGRALADYALKTDTDPAQARRARGEADFLTRRALKLDPDNDEVKRLSIEVAQLLPTAFDSPPGVAPSAPVQLKNEEKSGKKSQRLQPPSKKKPSPRLRSEKTTLSVDQAKAMIAVQHFYCAGWNDSGTGIKHQYEIQVLDDAVVVVDHATGLMWQKGGSGHDNLLIEQAEEYVGKLNAKKWAGFSDWRLPTLEEAMSLMTTQEGGIPDEVMLGDERIKGVMHLNPAFGKDEAPFIWTSDSESSDRGWVVYFWDGKCASEDFDFNAYVRAVRSSTTTDNGEQ